jgi:hypothetical protein
VTFGPGWPPPPPPLPPRRYSTKWIWIGVALGIAATMGLPFLGLVVAAVVKVRGVIAIVSLVALVVPLVLGIVFLAQEGTPSRKGLGLGLIIGWALAPIVFAGLCILVIVGAYTFPGSF